MTPAEAAMEETVEAAREVLETVKQHFGEAVRNDAALVIQTSLQLAIATAVACGSLNRELPDALSDRIRRDVCHAVQKSMTTMVYLLINGYGMNAEDAKAITKIIVSQVDRGLSRLNFALHTREEEE